MARRFLPLAFLALVACDSTDDPRDAGPDAAALDAGRDPERDSGTNARPDAGTDAHVPAPECARTEDCAVVTCRCVPAGDACGIQVTPLEVRSCDDGRCATDPAEICPATCQPNTWYQGTAPTATTFGRAFVGLPTPRTFDVMSSGSSLAGDSFVAIAASGYPRTVDIRTRLWVIADGEVEDVTPSLLTTFAPPISREQAVAVRGQAADRFVFITRGNTVDFDDFGRLYRAADGSITRLAPDVDARTLNALWTDGTVVYSGGRDTGPLLFRVDGEDEVARIELTGSGAVDTLVDLAGPRESELYAATQARIYRVQGTTATEHARPGSTARITGIAHANARLYALVEAGPLRRTLFAWSGTAWSELCTPTADLQTIESLDDGTLVVVGDATVLFDGTTWTQIADGGPTALFGSRSGELYGARVGLEGTGTLARAAR